MYNQEKKADAGKDRWELLPINQIQKVVKVLTDGAAKYGDNGWRSVDNPQERFYAAMMRHLYAWRTGDKIDKESGFNHMIHVICNAIFLAEFDESSENAFSKMVDNLSVFEPKKWTRAEDIKPIRAVDEDDKKEYHCRDCMKCKNHHFIAKDTGKSGYGPDGLYHPMLTESAHWCDAWGKEIPDTDIKLVNYCSEFEETKHE